ncbi:hypothetical protein, partial [Streptomyces bottropensis]|uniref:hypothetical protein n=1 Tax=Streptomyces bottropensis TaxID=42235 RepID=UPI0036B61BB5
PCPRTERRGVGLVDGWIDGDGECELAADRPGLSDGAFPSIEKALSVDLLERSSDPLDPFD